MRVTLNVTAGPHAGKVFSFDDHSTFVVGRSSQAKCQFSHEDRYFSRFHFVVEVNPPQCRIVDLNSRNGTFVNGQKLAPSADLADGDEIKAGHTFIRVRLETSPTATGVTDGDRTGVQLPSQAPPEEFKTQAPPPPSDPAPPAATGVWAAATIPPTTADICRGCGAETPPAPPPVALDADFPLCPRCRDDVGKMPQPFDGYLLVRELGAGGMGVVYRAVRAADGLPVALKRIAPTARARPSEVARFLREAEVLKSLNHPRIVAFRDVGEAAGHLFFVMDFIPGTDADKLMKKYAGKGQRLPLPGAVGLVCQALEALEYAHGKGYVHRDIKPANMLVASDGGRPSVRVADFGLARVYQSSSMSGITIAGRAGMAGTPAFMPPEHITDFRRVEPAADLYSAGATLYTLLTGECIFELAGLPIDRILLKILNDPPVPVRARRPEVPDGLAAVIHKCLEKEPAKRVRSAAELRKALLPFAR